MTRSCKLTATARAVHRATGYSLSGLSLGIHTFDPARGRRRRQHDDRGAALHRRRKHRQWHGRQWRRSVRRHGQGRHVTTFWRLFGRHSRSCTSAESPKGAKVTVTCKGKGCAFKKAKLTATGGKIKLAKRFKKRKLAAKTVITITVSDATGSKRFRYTLRARKFPKTSIK